MTKKKAAAETIEKRKVVMKSAIVLSDQTTATAEATDYVPVDILDAYVEDARTRWQSVEVEDGHNPGPAGDRGPTKRPKL